MPIEMGVWRIDGDVPVRLMTSMLPTEKALEEFLEKDPSLLGETLLVIARQLTTPHGKIIDLICIDEQGDLHVLELKRDKTPRDVVSQVLDYGSWVTALGRDAIIDIATSHLDRPFETAFEETFGTPPPDDLNSRTLMTIVAAELDASSERIATFLQSFGVPVNAVFFSYLHDDGRQYLTRSWLTDPDETGGGAGRTVDTKRARWNGTDWYVSFGDDPDGRSWEDARRHGFVSAGGGLWYTRTIRKLPVGARVNVAIPGLGYVGVGVTTGPARRAEEAVLGQGVEEVRMTDLQLLGRYVDTERRLSDEDAEWIVPVRWFDTVPRTDAYWEKGMFANQNSACQLRQEFTLERLGRRFRRPDDLE